MFYIIQSSVILNYFLNEVTGTTIFNLSLNSIRNTPSGLPPIKEQKIHSHLHRKKKPQNLTPSSPPPPPPKYERQISLLEEYRTSLISKAVTGQVDVRNWKPPETNTNE